MESKTDMQEKLLKILKIGLKTSDKDKQKIFIHLQEIVNKHKDYFGSDPDHAKEMLDLFFQTAVVNVNGKSWARSNIPNSLENSMKFIQKDPELKDLYAGKTKGYAEELRRSLKNNMHEDSKFEVPPRMKVWMYLEKLVDNFGNELKLQSLESECEKLKKESLETGEEVYGRSLGSGAIGEVQLVAKEGKLYSDKSFANGHPPEQIDKTGQLMNAYYNVQGEKDNEAKTFKRLNKDGKEITILRSIFRLGVEVSEEELGKAIEENESIGFRIRDNLTSNFIKDSENGKYYIVDFDYCDHFDLETKEVLLSSNISQMSPDFKPENLIFNYEQKKPDPENDEEERRNTLNQ